MNLEQEIFQLIDETGPVTFAELEARFPEFKGDMDFGLSEKNILYWTNLSKEAGEILQTMIRQKVIKMIKATVEDYKKDGKWMTLPVTYEFSENDQEMWMPIMLQKNNDKDALQ